MKKLSKLMAVVLAVAMVLALAACGSTGGAASAPAASGSGSAAPAGDGQTYKIGICQLVQHEALDAANQGFQDALTEKLGDARSSLTTRTPPVTAANCVYHRQRLRCPTAWT